MYKNFSEQTLQLHALWSTYPWSPVKRFLHMLSLALVNVNIYIFFTEWPNILIDSLKGHFILLWDLLGGATHLALVLWSFSSMDISSFPYPFQKQKQKQKQNAKSMGAGGPLIRIKEKAM